MLFLLICFICNNNIIAQKTVISTNPLRDFDLAINLFNHQQYQSASLLFEQIKRQNNNTEIQSDSDFYIAVSAIKSNQKNADVLMEQFLTNHPTSTRTNDAAIEVATFYFNQNNFDKSLQWFEKVDAQNLSATEQEQFYFQKGYSFFAIKNNKQATIFLNKVTTSKNFGVQAKYYLGYMAYQIDDFSEANKQFNQVSDQNSYKEKMSYYQADMNFRLGNFQKAIDLSTTAMSKSKPNEQSELKKIIGESYFNLNQFEKAISFLAQYEGKNGKWNNTDFYYLGYAYYKTNKYENAISQFNKIIDGKNEVAQNAYYHLGESYLKTGKNQQALNAFKNASEMDFELKIQEDAALNYAKLSYDIGNAYESVPQILTNFIEKYPKNISKIEIETLLINSYITSKNYNEALSLLEKNKKVANKKAYQKVTFYCGLQLFNDNNFTEASTLFKKSISEPVSVIFLARATFWNAETHFVQNQFDESLADYKKYLAIAEAKNTPEYKNINYNLGYNHFKLKQYDQASVYFQNYLNTINIDKTHRNDTFVRLGDCNFVLTKYNLALENYTKAIEAKSIDMDYASFQKGICYGFIAKNDKKIEQLDSFITQFPKSQYRNDALFELGNTFIAENKNEKAIAKFEQLYREFPNGINAPRAVLKQGLIYYNTDQDELALKKLKQVTTSFPGSPESIEAVATIRLIYLDLGKVNEYADWIKTLNFIEVTDIELDNDSFESAEKQYQENKTAAAIDAFEGYNAQFPNGRNSIKSYFNLAELYYSKTDEKKASINYEIIITKPKNEFTERALIRLSDIYIKSKDNLAAITMLKKLESEADLEQNKTFAQANLMKIFYEKSDFENAIIYSEKILANPKSNEKIQSDAQVIIAKSAIKTNNDIKARSSYANLLRIAKGELAAEALYYDAFFKNKDGKFEISNAAIQKLSKNYSSYKFYAAKGLVVMAKNFYGLKDAFQANYILDSVIKSFAQFPEVIQEAKLEKAKIITEEGKTNSSIQK